MFRLQGRQFEGDAYSGEGTYSRKQGIQKKRLGYCSSLRFHCKKKSFSSTFVFVHVDTLISWLSRERVRIRGGLKCLCIFNKHGIGINGVRLDFSPKSTFSTLATMQAWHESIQDVFNGHKTRGKKQKKHSRDPTLTISTKGATMVRNIILKRFLLTCRKLWLVIHVVQALLLFFCYFLIH